jgi:flavin reductase (DIM6/NTAB) family NADH-FMN oxidoreductase RutF
MPPVHPEELRNVMRQWTTGVTIVTSKDGELINGMTVNSFTSVSLNPPLVLVSLERGRRTHHLVLESRRFGITILGEGRQDLSDIFAGRVPDQDDRFAGLETFTLSTGAPLIAGGLAYLDCRVVATYEAGTHTVFIGEVMSARSASEGEPLVYFNRGYRQIAR